MESEKKESGTIQEVIGEYEKYLNIALGIIDNPDRIIKCCDEPSLLISHENEELKQVLSMCYALSSLLKSINIEVLYDDWFTVKETESVTYHLGFDNIEDVECEKDKL